MSTPSVVLLTMCSWPDGCRNIAHISSLTVRHPTQPPAAPTLSAIPTTHQSYLYMSHTHHLLATPTSHHFTYLVSHSHHSPVIPTTHQSRPPLTSHTHHPSVTPTTHQSRPPPISHIHHPSVTPTTHQSRPPPISHAHQLPHTHLLLVCTCP